MTYVVIVVIVAIVVIVVIHLLYQKRENWAIAWGAKLLVLLGLNLCGGGKGA